MQRRRVGGSGLEVSRIGLGTMNWGDGLESTLKRLGTDHLDLWQLPAWDATVPLDETLSAGQVAVLSGRARCAGLVAPTGWQLATRAERGRALGAITVPVSAQVEYSLLARDAEAELLPAALHHGVGLLAWAPSGAVC